MSPPMPDPNTMPPVVRAAIEEGLLDDVPGLRVVALEKLISKMMPDDSKQAPMVAVYIGMRLMWEHPEWCQRMMHEITKVAFTEEEPNNLDEEQDMLKDLKSLVEILPFTHSA